MPDKKEKYSKREQQIWDLAMKSGKIHDGELELDAYAKISQGESNGAYIQTWMWVDFAGTELDSEKRED